MKLLSVILILFGSAIASSVSAQSSLRCDLHVGLDQDLDARVKRLEACLDDMQFEVRIHDMQLMDGQIDDNRKQLIALEDRLYETEAKLTKADEKIEMLDLRILALESRASRLAPRRVSPTKQPTSSQH